MAYTVVSFHAHPDDEALLTGGTLARVAAQGHRVVLVLATQGEQGLASTELTSDLGRRRMQELTESAQALGCSRIVWLGYADSGYATGDRASAVQFKPRALGAGAVFAQADPSEAADRLAAILREERADVLTIYDRAGGYGHLDHVKVHEVGMLAAARAGTAVILQATIDRDVLRRVFHVVTRIPGFPFARPAWLEHGYSPGHEITHRVRVGGFTAAKRDSMRAHASQASADEGVRTLALLLRLPRPVYRLALGREWFVEVGRTPGRPPLDDIFATLRQL